MLGIAPDDTRKPRIQEKTSTTRGGFGCKRRPRAEAKPPTTLLLKKNVSCSGLPQMTRENPEGIQEKTSPTRGGFDCKRGLREEEKPPTTLLLKMNPARPQLCILFSSET